MKKEAKNRRRSDGRLPGNRKELLIDILHWRWTSLLALGLMLLAFSLPHIATLMYYDIGASVIAQGSADTAAKLVTLKLQTTLLQILTYTVLFFGLSGVVYLLRQLVWREPTGFFDGWWTGVRSNGLRFAAFGFCVGLLQGLNTFAEVLLHGFGRYLPRALFVGIVMPVLLYALTLNVVYRKKFGNLLSSAVVLYLKTVPVTLLFALLLSATDLVLLLPKFTLRYGILAAIIVVVLPVVWLVWTWYTFGIFDRFINKEHYPEICNKGVYVPDQTEDERGK